MTRTRNLPNSSVKTSIASPRNGRSKPDRAKLCATAVGFDSPTKFATSGGGLAARDGRVITADQLVLFSTETGDAWLLDPSDRLAARLARDGDPESVAFEETDAAFQIAWPGSYRLDGPAFVYTDRHSRRVSTIIGYPTQLLAAAERR
jgi:hypothetical protein